MRVPMPFTRTNDRSEGLTLGLSFLASLFFWL